MRPDLRTFAWTSGVQLTEALARHLSLPGDLEAEPVHLNAQNIEQQIRHAAPFTIPLPGAPDLLLGVTACRRGSALVFAPDLSTHRVPLSDLRDLLCRDVEAPLEAEIDRMLADLPAVSAAARTTLLKERLGARRIAVAWQLRTRPGSNFWRQVRAAGLIARLAQLAGAHVAEYALWLVAWWMIGSAALSGRIDWGWLVAWLLTLATIVPIRIFGNWSQSLAGIGLGGLLKQRLLAGAMELSPEHIRLEGAGQLLGCALEAETFESLAVTGGLASAVAALEVVLAGAVLTLGTAGPAHTMLLAVWLMFSGWLVWRFAGARATWTGERLAMTHDLTERMSGHRTRLAQSPQDRWHDGEDEALDGYLASSRSMDRYRALLLALVPRGWLVLGICGLAPAFVTAGLSAAPSLAVSLGGILLAHQALQRLTGGAAQVTDAVIAWRRIGPLFHAAAVPPERISATVPCRSHSRTVLEAHDLTFRYPGRTEPALRGAGLRIESGDWLLLEGTSGGGKSTLAALLAGLRRPESGLLLSGGLDRATLGEDGWRQRVQAAPQYHENHILNASLAFNLLMGRHWPPTLADLTDAETVCRELGLGDLLDRMPAGLQQMVGESGWQLSQGERSRVFLARVLLQKPELVLLDESFAALDPENLRQSLECVLRRAETLLVVAHP